jgi:hypothetical protein
MPPESGTAPSKPSFWSKVKSGMKSAGSVGVAAGGVVAGAALAGGRTGARGILSLHGKGTILLLLYTGILHILHLSRGSIPSVFSDPFLLLYFVAALIATLVYRDAEGSTSFRIFGKFVFLSFLAYIVPVLALTYGPGFLPLELIKLLSIFMPLWALYIFSNPGDFLTRWLAAAYWIGLSIWILFGIVFPALGEGAPQYSAPVLSWDEMKSEIVRVYKFVTKTTIDSGQAVINTGREVVTGNLNRTAPELFVGQVDNSEGLPLGVRHSDNRALFNRFRVDLGDSVTTTTSIRSRTLSDSEETIQHTCYLKTYPTSFSNTNVVSPTISASPARTILVYSGDFEDVWTVECSIPNKDVKNIPFTTTNVNAEVVLNSTYPFSTTGYMSYAFMERTLFTSLRQEGRDPAREMGVPARQVAKYTPGPVMIGMPSETNPFPYDANNPTLPIFGITLSNVQLGRGLIQEFSSIYVHVPAQFQLNGSACTPTGVSIRENPSGYGSYRNYSITVATTNRAADGSITIRCPLVVVSDQERNVLGPTGTAVYTILVETRYNYSLSSSTPVSLIVEPALSSSQLSLGAPNLNVAARNASCNAITPVCERPGEDAKCGCFFYRPAVDGVAAATLGLLTWPRPTTDVYEQYAQRDIAASTVPASCDQSTRCDADGACKCLLYKEGKPGTQSWTVRSGQASSWSECTRNANTGGYTCA